jgi:hypothetical protein
MTETGITYQTAFAGLADDQVAGDVPERCRVMLVEEPATRVDYERAWLRYLVRYHGLHQRTAAAVLECLDLSGAPSFRTVANRCQEIMCATAELRPPREVMEKRQRQRTQGRVR